MSDSFIMKQSLSTHQLQMLQSEMDKRKKSTAVAWILWLCLGGIGGHRYYLGYVGRGIAMTLTLGGLGFWALIDAFFIQGALRKVNDRIEGDVITKIKAFTQNEASVNS